MYEQGWCQWWEHLPLTNVIEVQTQVWTTHVGWVCCWFSPLLWKVCLGYMYSSFPLSSKINIFPNSNLTTNDSQRTIICRGSSLLTLKSFCTLSCADHIARARKVSSRFKLACPLCIYPFSQEQYYSVEHLPASVSSKPCSLDTFKAHVSCLNHLPAY